MSVPQGARAEEAPTAALGAVLLDVSINGDPQDVTPILRDPAGRFYVSKKALAGWRFRIPAAAPVVHEGEAYYPLDALPGVSASEEAQAQRLDIKASAQAFEASTLSSAKAQLADAEAEAFGAYLNYDLLAQKTSGEQSLGGFFEANGFTRWGVATVTAVANVGQSSRVTRLDTSWTFDSPRRMASLRIGDSFTRGGTGGAPLRFGGIQWTRNFATQPNFLTLPLPGIDGSAAAPSVVDIFVNNTLADRREVNAGPFRINELPALTGAGEVRLIVRDALGRETIASRPYYTSSQLLRKGLSDFSYELGFLRRNYSSRSVDYGALAASATHRYGISDRLTGEVHLEGTRHRQVVGVAADLLQSKLGVLNASVAASKSGGQAGSLVALGIERQASGFSFGARGELASRGYANVGLPRGQSFPSKTAQAFANVPTSFGALSASYIMRSGRGDDPRVQVLGASASVQIGWIGSLQFTAQRAIAGDRRTTFGLYLTRPLGNRRSTSSAMELGSGRRQGSATIQQSLPEASGIGYRASASYGEVKRLEAWAGYQGSHGLYDIQAARVGKTTGVRLGASGTIGTMSGAVFAARRLSESFAQVRVGDIEGVRVYSNNQLIGKTDKRGMLLVPRLLPYNANRISIDPADVPMDVILASTERIVRPYLRSGVVVRFGSGPVHGGLLRLLLPDGSPVPAGATIDNPATGESFVVAPGGEAYVTGLEANNRLRVTWGGNVCEISVPFRSADTAQQDLGDYRCGAVTLAAR